ncbi:DUF2516 family protein [Kineococcus terrestris]|uniref:DUF2516 family protein n=1 Tax=Kineococcus terrestris TaxID=2044856 RepID=UPI0034DAF045
MTNLIGSVQSGILLVISLAAFGLTVWALVDALRHSAAAYTAAGKRTKTFWVAVVAVAAAIAFVSLPLSVGTAGMPGLLGIVAVVAAAVYLADVRPAVRRFGGRRGPGPGTRSGPYGPW